MGRKNQNAFIKKQKEERKRKKREEKKQIKEARRSQPSSGNLEDMLAYLDEDGNIVSKQKEGEEENNDETPKDEPGANKK